MSALHTSETDELPSLELTLPPGAIALGRAGASAWVETMTTKLHSDLGFGWEGHPEPPTSVAELQAAFAHSAASQRPLPVAMQAEHPALMGLAGDLQLAFWRSIIRFRRSLEFSPRDNLIIDLEILDRAGFDNVSRRSRAVLYAALVGQSHCEVIIGRRPSDPRQFVYEALTYGTTDAILLEHERG